MIDINYRYVRFFAQYLSKRFTRIMRKIVAIAKYDMIKKDVANKKVEEKFLIKIDVD